MVQHSVNFTQLTDLDPVLTEIFYEHYNRELGMGGVMSLFNMQVSDKSKETDLRIDGFGDPTEFDGAVKYATANRGYEVEYVHAEFTHGFEVERALVDDMQYTNIFSRPEELGTSFARFRRKKAASVFNNGVSASYPGYDAVSLFNASHPRSRTDSTTVSNTYSLALTTDNLETVVVGMQDVKDSIGEEITVMPDTLVVPRALRKTALEVTGSELVPESANNTMNIANGAYNVIVDPYLSDSAAWFVVDSSMARRYLKWFERIPLEFAAENDFDTLIRRYRAYNRFSYGWSDFRWAARSKAS
jgi:phage major head subunit gpT-like protein